MNYNFDDSDEDNLQFGTMESNNRQNLIFDARRARPEMTRRYIDHSQAFTIYKECLPFNNYVQFPQNIPDQFRFLEPTFVYKTLATSLTSKFINAKVDKKMKSGINAMSWQPNGGRLVAGYQGGFIILWNGLHFKFENPIPCNDLNCAIIDLIWSHNGDFMLTVDQRNLLKVWQSNFNVIEQWNIHAENNPVRQLCFSPSDRKFATCSDDTTVKIWDLSTQTEEKTIENGINVFSVDWHPCRSLIASGTKDGAVRLADPRTGTILSRLMIHKNAVMKVQWNQNGNWILSCGKDSTVRLIDTRMMTEMMTFQGHEKDVYTIAWHPTQQELFVSGGYTGEMHWWCVGSERPIYSLTTAHSQAINQLRYHPLGHILASAGKEGIIKFWVRNRAGNDVTKSSTQIEANLEHSVIQANSSQIDIPGLPSYNSVFHIENDEHNDEEVEKIQQVENAEQEDVHDDK